MQLLEIAFGILVICAACSVGGGMMYLTGLWCHRHYNEKYREDITRKAEFIDRERRRM